MPANSEPQQDTTSTRRDTVETHHPEPPDKSLGSYLLDVPSEILRTPIYVVKGISWVAINGIYRNPRLRNLVNKIVAFDPVEGFKPVLSYGTNKGVRYGAGWQLYHVFRRGDDLFLRASYSTNEYQKHSVKYVLPAKFAGDAGLRFLLQYQTRTREDFYGLGNSAREKNEVSYYLEETQLSVDGLWRVTRDVWLELNGGYLLSNTFDGDSPDEINSLDSIEALFGLSDLDTENAEIVRIGATLDHDWRDSKGQPTRGGREIVSVAYSHGIGKSDELAFITTRAEVVHYLNIYRKRALAARVVVQSIDVEGDVSVVPFQLRSGLGGVDILRGYTSNRFLDNDLTAAAIEYRWPVWNVIDAFVFAEAGRVYRTLTEEFTLKNWHESFGTGLRIWNRDGVIVLLQAAVGDEETQFYLELGGEW